MIKERKDIPLEDFHIIIEPPENRFSTTCVTIYDDGKFNMNGNLSSILGGKELEIRLTDNCYNMCILDTGDKKKPIKFPKSGSRKIPMIICKLKDHGISLPAKYEMEYSKKYSCWQGEYVENPTKKPSTKPPSSKRN
ncbi:MAG: hypothetical protein E7476_04050 [Ruminococcaceae bacterium]|jgi:hypothetical protein|nr:hypothetical protein [Oscillospiraceae bacterium]